MGLKQDFVLRRLEDQGRFLARLILGKEEAKYELPEYEAIDNEVDRLYRKILSLADAGEINEAENILLGDLSENTPGYGIMVADFYQHLDEFEDDFLEEHDYSREEILEGLESLAEEYGLTES